MDLALHFPSLIKQGFTKANHLHVRDSLSPSFGQSFSRTAFDGDRRSWPGDKAWSSSLTRRPKNGSIVCCKNPSDEQSLDPSKSKQEEIIALLSRIQASISKGESHGAAEKNSNEPSGNESLSKAILDVLEKPREKTEGDAGGRKEQPKRQVARPPSSFAKRSPTRPSPASDPRELKEVAKSRGLKGYSKLKKSEILELLRSS
ncbi:Rho termination factor [Hirschfeldia incana]|nr:Rho termination factor [Hirschfeldia incana]